MRDRLFWHSFVTLQLAISGSGALPVARAFAIVGWPGGIILCLLTMALNKATTEWLLESAVMMIQDDVTRISYSAVCERAGFGRGKVIVEAFTCLLMTGSIAACLAALGETSARTCHGSATARFLAPVVGVVVAAVFGSTNYAGAVMKTASFLGVIFLVALVIAVVVAFLTSTRATDAESLQDELEGAPSAVATLGYSFYLAPVALAMLENHLTVVPEQNDVASIVAEATAATFLTTFLLYGALGVFGSLWLGPETPGDIATAFSANFIAPATALYLAIGLLPMFHPLEDSVNALISILRHHHGKEQHAGGPSPGGGYAACGTTATTTTKDPTSSSSSSEDDHAKKDPFARVAAVGALVVAALAARCNSITIFAFTGATGVCVTCYVVPVLCFWRIVRPARSEARSRRREATSDDTITKVHELWSEVILPGIALVFGVGVSALSLVLAFA